MPCGVAASVLKMAAERWKIDRIPCCVGPFVFCLEVPSDISAVNLESDVVVDIA